jgi:LacI family transcriptional regulator
MPVGKHRLIRSQVSKRDGRYVTLQDVARRAGVSAKTVSRVVNQQGEISVVTRQRIQKAIGDLGYRPNVLARSLIHQRTNTLATVAWGIDYFGPSRTVIGIEQQSDELGYSLLLSLVREPEFHDHQRILDSLLSRRVDGIIWAVPEVGENHSWLTRDQMQQLPPIVFLSMAPVAGLMVVAVDNRSGARQAVQHMIAQGRKRIGMLTGPLAWWEARERREGWRAAMQQAGLEAPDSLAVECHWSAAEGERAMRELLERAPEIDGVFAASDQIGLGAMDALAAAGRRVPADVALVGFDDIPEAPYFRPPLTTVHQKLGEVGRSAVRQLHAVIGLGAAGRRQGQEAATLIAPDLVVRASSI